MSKYRLQTKNGVLSDDDFVGDAPAIGSSDQKYSAAAQQEMEKLMAELAAKLPSKGSSKKRE